MRWVRATGAVVYWELRLLRAHPRLALACLGLLFVPALYAWIYLYAMWDPASHTRELPAGIISLDAGARYRDRELNLGRQMLAEIERHGQFAFTRYDDRAAARRDVRQGRLSFVLEIPEDFSRRALPGEQPGAAKITLYTSEGNNYAGAEFARRFAPEVAERVNTMLAEARWELVLSSAAGSQRSMDSLRSTLSELHRGAAELRLGLLRLREGSAQVAIGQANAAEAASRLKVGASQLADGVQQLGAGVRQLGSSLRALESRRASEVELQTLRQAARALAEAQRELAQGLQTLGSGAQRLEAALSQLRIVADDLPVFGSRIAEGVSPIADGARQLTAGLGMAQEAQVRAAQGAARLEDGVAALVEGSKSAVQALTLVNTRLTEDGRTEALGEAARELARGHEAWLGGAQQLAVGAQGLQSGLDRLGDGASRLDTALDLLRRALPQEIDRLDGSAQGLAQSVQPVMEVVAPVANQGIALTPNFVPLALWVGAVMVAFIVHMRRVPKPLEGLPCAVLAVGKLALPALMVLLQALAMLAMLSFVLKVPMPAPGLFALLLATTSLAFLGVVWMLVRLLGDLGRVVAVLLLIVQVSAAGALLPIQLSDQAFQAMHPYLPLTWVVEAFRASLFGAFEGEFATPYARVAAIGGLATVLGAYVGRWRIVSEQDWRPPLDID